MFKRESLHRNIQTLTIISLLVGAVALGRMWQDEKRSNAQLEHQVRIMAQKSSRIVELERSAALLVQNLNLNSTKVVSGTLIKAKLKKQVKGWDAPDSELDSEHSHDDLNSRNPYEALNAAVGGLTNVENNLEKFVASLTTSNQMLENQNMILAGVPSVKPADGWISSSYGKRRSPINGKWVHHNGLDIAANVGTVVIAAAAGVVSFAGRNGAYGNFVEIDHGQGVKTRYGHSNKLFVKKGEKVRRGQKISTIGLTGRTTGPHLHYEIHVNNKSVDPSRYIDIAPNQTWGSPVDPVLMAQAGKPIPMGGDENPFQIEINDALISNIAIVTRSDINRLMSAAIPFGIVIISLFFMCQNSRYAVIGQKFVKAFSMPFALIDTIFARNAEDIVREAPVEFWTKDTAQHSQTKIRSVS